MNLTFAIQSHRIHNQVYQSIFTPLIYVHSINKSSLGAWGFVGSRARGSEVLGLKSRGLGFVGLEAFRFVELEVCRVGRSKGLRA